MSGIGRDLERSSSPIPLQSRNKFSNGLLQYHEFNEKNQWKENWEGRFRSRFILCNYIQWKFLNFTRKFWRIFPSNKIAQLNKCEDIACCVGSLASEEKNGYNWLIISYFNGCNTNSKYLCEAFILWITKHFCVFVLVHQEVVILDILIGDVVKYHGMYTSSILLLLNHVLFMLLERKFCKLKRIKISASEHCSVQPYTKEIMHWQLPNWEDLIKSSLKYRSR